MTRLVGNQASPREQSHGLLTSVSQAQGANASPAFPSHHSDIAPLAFPRLLSQSQNGLFADDALPAREPVYL